MYVGTKYEEERRIQEKRKKEGSRCRGRCYVSRQISTLFFGSAKVETSKSCLWTRCSTQEYVAHNYILHKVLKYESRKKAPRLWTMPNIRPSTIQDPISTHHRVSH